MKGCLAVDILGLKLYEARKAILQAESHVGDFRYLNTTYDTYV